MNKKGITPVISIVLMIMITVSAASAGYFWMGSIQSNLQVSAQNAISSTGLGGNYQISALAGGVICESGVDGTIQVYVSNTGSNNIEMGDWYIFVKDSINANVGTWTNTTFLNSGETVPILFEFLSGSSLSNKTQYVIQINSPKGGSATTSCLPK